MKVSCDVIKDLLLLYENEEASEATRKLVEEHIKHCPECKALLEHEMPVLHQAAPMDETKQEEVIAVKKGLGKIKKRWKLSLVSVLMIIPILAVGVLAYHEYTGVGITFTNLDEIQAAKKFMHLIENGEFEKAAQMKDYTSDYGSIVAEFTRYKDPRLVALYGADPTKEEHAEVRNEKLVSYLEKVEEMGYSFSNMRYNQVYHSGGDEEKIWTVQIAFTEHGPDGFEQNVIAQVECMDGKILHVHATEEKRFSAFEYAMCCNNLWNLERTPSYEEYVEMEKNWFYQENE